METMVKQLESGVYTLEESLKVEEALLKLSASPEVVGLVPEAKAWREHLLGAKKDGDLEEREYALLELYRTLHTAGSGYSKEEQERLNQQKGLHGLSGGLMPLFLAARLMDETTRMVDLGAGNGLQGILLQRLAPHAHTLQVELSSSHVAMGKLFQKVSGVPQSRMDWHIGDLFKAELGTPHLIYLYRPVRPSEVTKPLYQKLAKTMETMEPAPTIVSVADCLTPHFSQNHHPLYASDFIIITKPGSCQN